MQFYSKIKVTAHFHQHKNVWIFSSHSNDIFNRKSRHLCFLIQAPSSKMQVFTHMTLKAEKHKSSITIMSTFPVSKKNMFHWEHPKTYKKNHSVAEFFNASSTENNVSVGTFKKRIFYAFFRYTFQLNNYCGGKNLKFCNSACAWRRQEWFAVREFS